MAPTAEELQKELARVREELADRRKSMPAHSVRPWQLAELEELEDRERELRRSLSEKE